MKLDTKRLIDKYIVLSKDGLAKNEGNGSPICGPIDSVSYRVNALVLKMKNASTEIIVNIDENDETADIEFISRHLWRATLYNFGRKYR